MIFLTHSWKDKPAARKLVEALAFANIPCWLDEQQLDAGAELRALLRSAIAQSNVYLYLVSASANESKWAQDELAFALGLEIDGKLKIIPVRLAGNTDPLPSSLAGKIYRSLDPTTGGVARLAQELMKVERVSSCPQAWRLSASVRMEGHRLVHTLLSARQLGYSPDEVDVMLLRSDYEILDGQYWSLCEVAFPSVNGLAADLGWAAGFVAQLHDTSRSIIRETRRLCRCFVSTSQADNQAYFDAAYIRAIYVLLHRLQWNTKYLLSLRDKLSITDEFVSEKTLAMPFDGHSCDFAVDDKHIGSVIVPKHGHPWPAGTANLIPWGLTSPFADMLPDDVGVALGDYLARCFIAQTTPSVDVPNPDSIKYGLRCAGVSPII